MKNRFYHIYISLLIASACSSELQTPKLQAQSGDNGINVNVSVPNFVSSNKTKSIISTTGTFSWATGDRIGLFSNQIDSTIQTPSQLALSLSAGEGTSTAYSSTNGWTLVYGSTFNYFSYYPYSETNTREKITINYIGQSQNINNSPAGLGQYDYLYSDMAMATSSSSATFSFHHVGCLVNVNITVPAGYEKTTFYKMRLYADTPEFTSAATYSVNDIVTSGAPSLEKQNVDGIELSFGNAGITPSNGVINAWLMMAPAQWSGKAITTKLYAAKNNVPTLSGIFTPDVNQIAGTQYAYAVTSSVTAQTLPDKPTAGEQLHVLLFCQSLGYDCIEYLPAITYAAGITNVHYGKFYGPGYRLYSHWGHITSKTAYGYYNSEAASTTFDNEISRKVDDVLTQYPWDIIIFQHACGFAYEGSYSSYQPYLNDLSHYVDSVCTKANNKTPLLGWSMGWAYNPGYYYDYDRGEITTMYQAIVTAVQNMVEDTTKTCDIPIIIAPGTAIQNARGTSLNDNGTASSPSTTRLLTRDGIHASYGIGRYTAACTWFQRLIAPIYGTTITGNAYRPAYYSFPKDIITNERAAICWQCAIEAVKHPYEVTPISE